MRIRQQQATVMVRSVTITVYVILVSKSYQELIQFIELCTNTQCIYGRSPIDRQSLIA